MYMDDIKREELEKACKKIHKIRSRMVAVRMVRVLNMWMRLPTSKYTVPRGSVTGCAATTKGASKASGIFPDAGGPEEFCETSWMR